MAATRDGLKTRLAKLYQDVNCCVADFRQAKEAVMSAEDFQSALGLLRALADENRLALIKLLQRYDELCVCEIEAAFPLVRSTLIHHLNILMDSGLLRAEKRGKWTYYQLSGKCDRMLQIVLPVLASNARSKGESA